MQVMIPRHAVFLGALCAPLLVGADADLILHGGKILTVDNKSTVVQAIAIKEGRIAAVGTDKDILAREKGAQTRLVDLRGKTVLPGLNDAHVHTLSAGLSEFREPLPPLGSIADIQDYIKTRALVTPKGEW